MKNCEGRTTKRRGGEKKKKAIELLTALGRDRVKEAERSSRGKVTLGAVGDRFPRQGSFSPCDAQRRLAGQAKRGEGRKVRKKIEAGPSLGAFGSAGMRSE